MPPQIHALITGPFETPYEVRALSARVIVLALALCDRILLVRLQGGLFYFILVCTSRARPSGARCPPHILASAQARSIFPTRRPRSSS